MGASVELNPQPLPPKAVTVYVGGDLLSNFDQFLEVQKSILGRLGCGGCTSGFDISWTQINEFMVDENLNIRHLAPPSFGR